MSAPAFTWTSRAWPVIQIGVGDTRTEQPAAVWDVQRWDAADAEWSGLEPVWEDVTCEAFSMRCEYGRSRATDRFVAGAMTVVVWNATGWADPNALDDPAVLTMRPGRAIRVGVQHTVYGTRWLFRGFIDAMSPVYDPTQPDTVELSCIDALGEVNRAKVRPVDPPIGAGESVTARLVRLLDLAEWPSQKRALAPSGDTLIASDMGGQIADLLSQAADSGGGNVYGDLNANVAYKNRDWQMFDPSLPPDSTIGNVQTEGYTIPGTPAVDGYLTGTLGSVSTPDAPADTVTGDLRMRARVRALSMPTTGGASAIAMQRAVGAADLLFDWRVLSTGSMDYRLSANGTSYATGPTVLPVGGIVADADRWIGTRLQLAPMRILGDVSNDQGSTWTQVADSGALSPFRPFDSASPVTIGGVPSGYGPFPGRIYWAQLERVNRAQLVFPGVVGNYLFVAGAGVVTSAATREVVVRFAVDDWDVTQTELRGIVWRSGSFIFRRSNSARTVQFVVYETPTTVTIAGTYAAGTFTAGQLVWMKATFNSATGAGVISYSTSTSDIEPTTWTTLVSSTYATGTLTHNTGNIDIGRDDTARTFRGRIARVIVRDGIGAATPVLDVADQSVSVVMLGSVQTFTARTGQTVYAADTIGGPFLGGSLANVSTPDAGVLPGSFVIVYRSRNLNAAGFPVHAAQNTGSDPRSWQSYPTLNNTRIYIEATADGAWANRQIRWADRPIPRLGVDHTEAVAVTPNAAGRHVMTAWTYDDATGMWTAGTTRDTGTALTPFDVTTAITAGGGYTAGERLYSVEMRTGTDPRSGTLLWRFDAAERTGTGLTYTDPRGRVWTLTSAVGVVSPVTAQIVQPQPDSIVWRFDANEYPGSGTQYVDPRGRVWTLSAAGAITPMVPAEPDVYVPADICPVQWERPFARADLATRVLIGRDIETAQQLDDIDAQRLYGIEPFERTDLLTQRDDTITTIGERILAVRSAFSAPRIRSVTLDARTADDALDLMSTVDVYKPSRYRCRLQYPEPRGLVFDALHMATGVVHEMTPSSWSLALNLDLAEPFKAIGGRWDGAYWDAALWADAT